MEISAEATFSRLARSRRILSWESLKDFISKLPYRRTSDPKDISRVLSEGCGTCSGKHAVLFAVAKENAFPDVHLMVSAFKMSAKSHPKVQDVLEHFHLDYIPEAHCYLTENGAVGDYTRPGRFAERFEILDTRELQDPERIAEEKTAYHKQFLEKWRREMFLPYSPEELWRIREACIMSLSE